MFQSSIIEPKIARRHLIRTINSYILNNKTYNHNSLDNIKIHNQEFTIMFLNNQLWDKITDGISTSYITRQDFIRKFNLSPNESTRIYNLINVDKAEYINCDSFCKYIVTNFSITQLKYLYMILYSSSTRRQKRIEKRRSSSLIKKEKPIVIEIIAKPVIKSSSNTHITNIIKEEDKKSNYELFKSWLFCC